MVDVGVGWFECEELGAYGLEHVIVKRLVLPITKKRKPDLNIRSE